MDTMDPNPQKVTTPPIVKPVTSHSTNTKWPWIILVIVLFLAFGTGGVFLGKQMAKPVAIPTPIAAAPTTAPDPTANWETYVNNSSKYSVKYPSDWKIENISAGSNGALGSDARFIQIWFRASTPTMTYGNLGIEEISILPASEEKLLTIEKELASGLVLRCNGNFTDNSKTWCWVKIPTKNAYLNIQVFKGQDSSANQIYEQILSTFKFINLPSDVQPTPIPLTSVSLFNTTGWITAENNIFSIKYPSDTFRTVPAGSSIQLQWKNNTGQLLTNSPDFWLVDNYQGGSVKEWYINHFNYYPNEVIFTEKRLGTLNVVEAKPKNLAETHILISDGKNLVNIMPQGADLKLVETISSTLIFK